MLAFGVSKSGFAVDTPISEPRNIQTVQTTSRPQVQIGILENVDPWFFVQMFGPTMEYLRDVLPAYDVKLELGRGRGISNLDKKARITRLAPLI